MPQAVGGAGLAFRVELENFLVQDRVEEFVLPFRKEEVCLFDNVFGPARLGLWSIPSAALWQICRH